MMIFKPYNKHKQSDIDWLGAVPQHWNLFRTDSVTKYIRNQINPESIQAETVFHYSIPIVQETGTGLYEPTDDLGSAKQLISMKSVLVSKLNPRKATICIAEPKDEVTICSSEFIAMEAKNCDLKYLYYLMNSEMNRQRLDSRVQSVTRSHQRVYPSDIYRFWTALPLTIEQQTIVSFLDRETTRIDALIQKKERMIELLKEKRIALITQAVTKGLDPNVPMKDSGIEWLGEVPEHWDVKRLRYCIRLNPSKKEISHLPKDTEVSFLPMENVGEDGALDLSENRAISEVDSGYTYFGENDVAIAKITPCFENGKGCVFRNLEHGYGFGSTELTVMRPINLVPEFLYYLTVSTYFRKIGEALMHGSAGQKRVPDDYIRNLYLGLPSIEEQQQIVCYVHEKLRSIEALNALTSLSIDKLREYRSSLIHHAVTGKIDLRGYDAQEQ